MRQRMKFMTTCQENMPDAPDYCSCGWEQFRQTFTAEEMESDHVNEARMAAFKDKVASVCATKIPERKFREVFVNACMEGKPKAGPYCECSWTELRKQLEVTEFSRTTPKFRAAKKAALKACYNKASEEIFRDGFFSGCVKKPELKPFCSCAWTALRKEASPADLEMFEDEDWAKMKPKVESSCGRLRPK